MDLDLSASTRSLIARERTLLHDLRALLARTGASEDALESLRMAMLDLEGVFLLVVVGEYNAGKSSLLNALLGAKVMPEGVTPTTDRVTVVTHGEEAKDLEESASLLRRTYPAPLLRDVALVDTPGTNAVIRRHQELTERFVPRADLVLFVTSADRPFTESERAFLELIAAWGKKITLVVNKLDILEDPEERAKVLDYVRDNARETLGVTPQVFGVAARRAYQARQAGEAATGTGLPELEAYIESTLRADERLKLKLASPLGVARNLARRTHESIHEALALLQDDRATLEQVERQRALFEKDMRRETGAHLVRVKTVLLEVERRGEVFFDDTVRFRNVLKLLDSERIREAFETKVVRGADREIELAVAEMVDWFIARNLQLWEDVMTFVNERRRAAEERVIGEVGGRFQYDRDALIRALRERAASTLEGYDEQAEARRLADRLQASVVQTGLLQVGGLGLGAAVLAFVSGAALDVTGVTLGLTVAGLGLLVLPRRRAQAKRDLHEKMQALRDGLEAGLGAQLERELERAAERLSAAIAPYTRFVRAEIERLEELQQELAEIEEQLDATRRALDGLELSPAPAALEPPGDG